MSAAGRRLLVGAMTLLVVGGAATVALAVRPAAATPVPHPRSIGPTIAVERRDLVATTTLDGALGFPTPDPVRVRTSGTITWLPAVGAVLRRDSILIDVDGRPVPVIIGRTPLYRTIAAGCAGPDVLTVARDLEALGLLHAHYTAATTTGPAFAEAVRAWRRRHGLPDGTTVGPGDAVVLPTTSRVAQVSARPGDAAGGAPLEVSGLTKIVTASVSAFQAGALRRGAAAVVTLPDGRTTPARVASVGAAATGGDGTDPKLQVVVALDDPAAAHAYDTAPVTIEVPEQTAHQVLVVPVAALLALRDGGYAVQRADGRLLPVTTGLFAGDEVAVAGAGVAPGLRVGVAP